MRVVAVSDGEIVVEPAFRFDDGSAASPRQTLQLDPERTQVFESVIVNQRTDDRGRIIMETKPQAVELERAKSLKEGQRVQVGQQAGVAVDIVIMPTLPTTRRATPRSATTRSRSRTTRPARMTTQPATRS